MEETKVTTEDLIVIAKETLDELAIVDEDLRQDVYLHTITNRHILNTNNAKDNIKNFLIAKLIKDKDTTNSTVKYYDRMKMYEAVAKVLFYDLDSVHRDALIVYYDLDPAITEESTGISAADAQDLSLEAIKIIQSILFN